MATALNRTSWPECQLSITCISSPKRQPLPPEAKLSDDRRLVHRLVPDSHEWWVITTKRNPLLGGVVWVTGTTSNQPLLPCVHQSESCENEHRVRQSPTGDATLSCANRRGVTDEVTPPHLSWVLSVCVPHVNSWIFFPNPCINSIVAVLSHDALRT